MLTWLGRLFGTAKGMDTALGMANRAMDGIDAIVYTEEEKATHAKEVLFKLQDQFAPRSISRRIIAFMFVGTFCLSFLVALVFTCLSLFGVVENIINLVVAFKLPIIIITIVIFYFGYYGIHKAMGKK